MSTAYYLHRIPSQEKIDELMGAVERTKTGEGFSDVTHLVTEMYNERETRFVNPLEAGVIYLGHRAGGWKFLWMTNMYRDLVRTEDGDFFEEYKLAYPLTREGITNLVMDPNYVIYDEYGVKQDKIEFLDMAFNWEPNGFCSWTENSSTTNAWDFSKEQMPFKEMGYEFEKNWQWDFLSDGLRFSILQS